MNCIGGGHSLGSISFPSTRHLAATSCLHRPSDGYYDVHDKMGDAPGYDPALYNTVTIWPMGRIWIHCTLYTMLPFVQLLFGIWWLGEAGGGGARHFGHIDISVMQVVLHRAIIIVNCNKKEWAPKCHELEWCASGALLQVG